MKTILLWAFLPLFLPLPGNASTGTVTLEALLEEAESSNPAVRAALQRWEAAKRDSKVAGALPDPNLSAGVMVSHLETRAGPMKGRGAVSQQIPFWGKRGLRAEAAKGSAGAAEAAYRAKLLEIRAAVASSYYDLAFFSEAGRILSEQVELLRHFSRVAEKKYATGRGSQATVFRAQAEISRMKNEVFVILQQSRRVKAGLQALLGRGPGEALGEPQALSMPALGWAFDAFPARALENRPELLALRALADRSEAKRRLALRRFFPDFMVGYEYTAIGAGTTNMSFDGKDAHGFIAGMSIPLWLGANRAGLNSADASRRAADFDLEALEKNTLAEAAALIIDCETYQHLIDVDEDTVIPQVRSAAKAVLGSYEADSASFVDLLDAQRMALESELGHARHKTMFWKTAAVLERVVGGPL